MERPRTRSRLPRKRTGSSAPAFEEQKVLAHKVVATRSFSFTLQMTCEGTRSSVRRGKRCWEPSIARYNRHSRWVGKVGQA